MATLTGSEPPDEMVPSWTSLRAPSRLIRSTDTWSLPASTATTKRPSLEVWIAPCDARPEPVPAPPVLNGEPAVGVRLPSACLSNAPTVFVPAVLSFTYTWPAPRSSWWAGEALAGTAAAAVAATLTSSEPANLEDGTRMGVRARSGARRYRLRPLFTDS